MYLDKWHCVNYKYEGVTWHLSSQSMLELLANSIMEGPLHSSYRSLELNTAEVILFPDELISAIDWVRKKIASGCAGAACQVHHWGITSTTQVASNARKFLVACYVTLHPTLSVRWSVGRLVGWSVGPHFTFSVFLSVLSSLLLPKCPSDLLYHCPCPSARD